MFINYFTEYVSDEIYVMVSKKQSELIRLSYANIFRKLTKDNNNG